MAKHIMQFRYYKKDNENNQPEGISKETLKSGDIFTKYLPFTQIGIQALPGTRFYLNSNLENPIIIGSTGIYELELEGVSKINSLKFEGKSLDLIESNNNVGLIIDVIYEG